MRAMTTWEIGTSGVMPVDMVREQDFILKLRRLQRLGTPHLAANLVLSAIPAVVKSRGTLENMQAKLKEVAKITNAEYAEMSNGDVFLIWEETGDAELLANRVVGLLPVESQASSRTSFLLTYKLPQDYTKLRERSNHYIEVVRAAAIHPDGAADALKSDTARGPLTAWGVDQIGKLLGDIDIRTYARTQTIYRYESGDVWRPVAEEYFISFDDLRRERFPKLDLITPEHLFFSLCETVDHHLLTMLAKGSTPIFGKPFHLNLSIASVIGSTFTQFTHSVPREKRGFLTFELHRGDIFQDFARTLSAIEILHKEGFKVAMDSVTPDMVPYINLNAFSLDLIKVNVSGDRAALLRSDIVQTAMRHLPPEKLVFFRCDSNHALQFGQELGVKLFQGWRIDDLVGAGKKQP